VLARAERIFRKQTRSGALTLQAGSITALPLPDASLDAAITVNTIYFVDDLDLAFAELARVLRPGARVVVGLGDPDAMADSPVTAHGFVLRSVDDVLASLARAGLQSVGHRRVGQGDAASHLLVARKALG
jgi:ubiquinone/menaquinone biosynthesis C-methylase UbiE